MTANLFSALNPSTIRTFYLQIPENGFPVAEREHTTGIPPIGMTNRACCRYHLYALQLNKYIIIQNILNNTKHIFQAQYLKLAKTQMILSLFTVFLSKMDNECVQRQLPKSK